jgi:hypothetical protein
MGISLLSGTAIEERTWWVVITKEYSSATINIMHLIRGIYPDKMVEKRRICQLFLFIDICFVLP